MKWLLAISGLMAVAIAPIAASAASRADRVLPDDAVRAINVCMAASHAVMPDNKMELRDSIDAAWYLIEGIREFPQPGSLSERMSAFPDPDDADGQVSSAEAPPLVNQCRQRWNNSHRGAIEIMLPVDRYDRDTQCYSVISFVAGMVDNRGVRDEEGLGPRIKAKRAFYDSHLTERVLAGHGLNTIVRQDRFYARRLLGALDLGNLNDVVDACLKNPNGRHYRRGERRSV